MTTTSTVANLFCDATRSASATKLWLNGTGYIVLRWYHDGSGAIAAFGPFANHGDAVRAQELLTTVGIPDRLTILPCYSVDAPEVTE